MRGAPARDPAVPPRPALPRSSHHGIAADLGRHSAPWDRLRAARGPLPLLSHQVKAASCGAQGDRQGALCPEVPRRREGRGEGSWGCVCLCRDLTHRSGLSGGARLLARASPYPAGPQGRGNPAFLGRV